MHDFGIIDSFEEDKWYSIYEPDKYNCVAVSDELIAEVLAKHKEELSAIRTYYQVKTQPGTGLDYCGVTLIPPESLSRFRDVIIKAFNDTKAEELQRLIDKISEAIKENKYVIHYGL